MSTLILHHFDISPFAEKIRKVLGLKGLSWRSVQIPIIMPKPHLTALTGGYRKTPVLQIGADIFCDTRRIALELERRYPTPTLFPGDNAGMDLALSAWSDRSFFEPGAGLSMGENPEIPAPVLEDRKAFFNFMDFDRLPAELGHLHTQLRANASLVARQLADGRPFLYGDQPGWADVNAWFVLWMCRANIPGADRTLAPFERLGHFETRMAAIGIGEPDDMDAAEALDVARSGAPSDGDGVDKADPLGLAVGTEVTVAPDDYGKDPVRGRLITLTVDEVAIRRHDDRAGEVAVHFPRAGYRVTAGT